MPRHRTHFEQMFKNNPRAMVGVSLAACACYAARYGEYDPDICRHEEWREIFRVLKRRYGDALDTKSALAEMKKYQEENNR